jgi:hypothetical protein
LTRHIVIPDTQVKAGVPIEHHEWIGKYIVDKKPDTIIGIGDHADMHSLSSFDTKKSDFHSRRYKEDIAAANEAWSLLNKQLDDYNAIKRQWREKQYRPAKHVTLGNHEYRIERAIDADRVTLEGMIGMDDLNYEQYGWTVHDFLKPVQLDGIQYAHYFANPNTGRPYAGANIETRLKSIGFSFVMGHQQGKLIGERHLNNNQSQRGLVIGSCYLHREDYRGHQAQTHWRGIAVLNEVKNGYYDLTEVSLEYLCRKYYWQNDNDDKDPRGLCAFMQKEHPKLENIFDVGNV